MLNETPTERAALEWLYSTQLFGIKLGLDNTRKLLGVLGLPKEGQKYIHVAGTNGKGSVCAFLHGLFRASGLSAGLFTSPHLVHFRERIRDGERQISSAEISRGIETLKKITADWQTPPTFFELTFALGMDWFRKRELEWAVLETGMGGRLDATNTITPEVCVITNIGFDHQSSLGNTLEAIASEKAGIIKPGVPVVTIKQKPEVMKIIADTARERGAPLTIVTTPIRGYQIGLLGQHQLWNATLAVAAFKAAGFKPREPVLRQGLRDVEWPARFQRFDNENMVLDGAHNQDSIDTLVRVWQQFFQRERAQIVFGCVKGRELVPLLRSLQSIAAGWHFTNFESQRAELPEDVQGHLKSLYGDQMQSSVHASPEHALNSARKHPERVLVTGSLYLVGEVLAQLRGEKEWFQSSLQ
ncbi:bifunctional folylpolyglutamate synthase/dihydrofolate synthase [Phragmitibacter flavus]|uniref:bifunctional folylpolyglutamate synthase/dihydrofolate synthase n=1 Tax=Phragmitibacter flavus TaxID=2576071 RepID=UPI00140C73F5|nr:folylpolyglutamate synthase/dihydrofolate synthase family protein [Phragmitibacter flavus]